MIVGLAPGTGQELQTQNSFEKRGSRISEAIQNT